MNATKKEIEEAIVTQIFILEQNICTLKELTKAISPDDSVGRISRMDAINNRSVNEAALRQSELKLKKLQLALENINRIDFGKCKRCGKDISPKRIALIQESLFCVNCANR